MDSLRLVEPLMTSSIWLRFLAKGTINCTMLYFCPLNSEHLFSRMLTIPGFQFLLRQSLTALNEHNWDLNPGYLDLNSTTS